MRPIQSKTFCSFLFPSGCQIIIFNQQHGSLSRSNGLIYLIWQQVSTNEKSTSNKRRMNSFPFVFMHNSCTTSLCLSLSVSASEIDYFTSDPSCRYYTPKGKQIWFICIPIHKESHTYSVIPCVFHLNPVVIWIWEETEAGAFFRIHKRIIKTSQNWKTCSFSSLSISDPAQGVHYLICYISIFFPPRTIAFVTRMSTSSSCERKIAALR